MTVTLNLPSCFMWANIRQFATLFLSFSFFILSSKSLMLCQMSPSSKSSRMWTRCTKIGPIHTPQACYEPAKYWGHWWSSKLMQGCMFHHVPKRRARGLIFSLTGCLRGEKVLSGTPWERFTLPPSSSVSQSLKTASVHFIGPCETFNLFALLPLLFPAIDCAHHKLYCR